MLVSLCMCELHATDDVQGILSRFKHRGSFGGDKISSREACGKAVGTHIWMHREWKLFKHKTLTRPAGSSIRGLW